MNNNDLNNRIKDAFDKATPDVLDRILSDVSEGREIIIVNDPPKKRYPMLRRIAAAAAAIVVAGGLAFGMYTFYDGRTVASTVSLDVNPSVMIRVNSKETVLDVTAMNEDGEQIIGGVDYTGSDLDITVSALIGSMLKHGYISEISNSILVSVDDSNRERSDELRSKLTREIGELLETESFTGSVMSQTVEDDDLETLSEKYGITVSKAQLIKRIVDSGRYSFDELAALSINELNLIADSDNTDVKDVDQLGSPSDKAYIGQDNAIRAVMEYAGLNTDKVSAVSASISLQDSVMVYEIALDYSGIEYGFMVNATNGSVLMFFNNGGTIVPAPDTEAPATEAPVTETEPPVTETEPVTEPVVAVPEPIVTETETSQTPETEPVTSTATVTTPKPVPEPDPDLPVKISEDDAKLIAARHAGAENAIDFTCQMYMDNGTPKYKIRFWATDFTGSSGIRYDYVISAYSGTVITSGSTEDKGYTPSSREVFEPGYAEKGHIPYTYYEYCGYSLGFLEKAIMPYGNEFNTSLRSDPVLTIDSKEKLDRFLSSINDANIDYGGNAAREAKAFLSDLESYGEDFFKEKSLYIVTAAERTMGVDHTLSLYYDGAGNLNVNIERRDHGIGDRLAQYKFFLIEVDRDDVNGFTATVGSTTDANPGTAVGNHVKKYYMILNGQSN